MQQQRYALLSVSDKTGLEDIAQALQTAGLKLIATGGSKDYLNQHGYAPIDIEDFASHPEMLGGRVKTLQPKVHGAILAREQTDAADIAAYNLNLIDFVVVNLYPFAETIDGEHDLSAAIEKIDIGGPTLLRAAAKNYDRVTAICDPSDYPAIIAELEKNKQTSMQTRRYCASQVFRLVTSYNAQIADYLEDPEAIPQQLQLIAQKQADLRYGENPTQQAARYNFANAHKNSLACATPLQGKQLSFNNILDAEAAWKYVNSLQPPSCAIIKHNTACGVASCQSAISAYKKALACDAQSAFGGIVAFNCAIDNSLAQEIITQQFVEVLLAPDFSPEALQVLSRKPNCRCLKLGKCQNSNLVYSIDGGLLYQTEDLLDVQIKDWKLATAKHATQTEKNDLSFAWQVVKHVKSNAIVFAKDQATIGIGTGQTSRIFSMEIAALKASHAGFDLNGAVMASDAFFPFKDAIYMAQELKISAIIQPGGSKRDPEVIEAADAAKIAMYFTGTRHFKH